MADNSFDLYSLVEPTNKHVFQAVVGDRDLVRQFRIECEQAGFFWVDHHLCVRQLDGARMMNREALLREFDAALQMPYGLPGWDSLEDWLGSLEWMPPGAGYVFLITAAERVLEQEPENRAVLTEILRNNAMGWGTPATEGATRGRPPVPFHVVVAGSSLARLRAAWGDDVVAFADPSSAH
jgi:hypothetical protein